jgi:hypothetical protein
VATTSASNSASTAQSPAWQGQRFVARQPIFNRVRRVFGYELLFRNGIENCFHGDPDQASRRTLDSSLLLGMETLFDGRLGLCELHAPRSAPESGHVASFQSDGRRSPRERGTCRLGRRGLQAPQGSRISAQQVTRGV